MCEHHFPGKVCVPDPAHVNPDGTGVGVISLDATNGDVFIGGPAGGFGHRGRLVLTNAAGTKTYEIDGETGTTSQSGDIVLLDVNGNERVRISGQTAEVIIKNAAGAEVIHLDGKTADIAIGGGNQDGLILVRNEASVTTIRLDGDTANVTLGGGGQDGDVIVRNGANAATVQLDGATGNVTADGTTTTQTLMVNGAATAQNLTVNAAASIQSLTVNAATTTQDLTVNGATTTKDITVTNSAGTATIELDGNAGDIRLLGADCAEDFDILETAGIEPGTVMVLSQEGKLCQSAQAYDKRVAGVISGAGNYRPGIVLDQQRDSQNNRLPVALMGKVYCKVDADLMPVEVGDLLTTSFTPGYAMKASDPYQAFGAIIGKALRPLNEGKGLIPILVALQ
jgi:hypothetical protein